MEEGFDHLRCPMCGGELVYSEGTHDLCCRNNPYELAGSPGPQAKEVEKGKAVHGTAKNEGGKTALHETAADYLAVGGEGRNGFTAPEEYGEKSSRGRVSVSGNNILSADAERHSGTRTEGSNELRVSEFQGWKRTSGVVAHERNSSLTPSKTHECVFAVSFTESGRHGTLWSVRTVHDGTNYVALIRLMQDVEKRQSNGEPLAANVPNLPRKTERSATSKLAFRYSLEVEDLYSIKYSSETVDRLAAFYGLSVRDIRHIKSADIPEGE